MSYMTVQTNGLNILGKMENGFDGILTPEALEFIENLERHFGSRRKELLEKRMKLQ